VMVPAWAAGRMDEGDMRRTPCKVLSAGLLGS